MAFFTELDTTIIKGLNAGLFAVSFVEGLLGLGDGCTGSCVGGLVVFGLAVLNGVVGMSLGIEIGTPISRDLYAFSREQGGSLLADLAALVMLFGPPALGMFLGFASPLAEMFGGKFVGGQAVPAAVFIAQGARAMVSRRND